MSDFYKMGLEVNTFEIPTKIQAYADKAHSLVDTVKEGSIDFYHGSRRFYDQVTKGTSERGIPRVVSDAVGFVRLIGGIFAIKNSL